MSYSPDRADLYRRAAGYVDRILRGANPADMPVEQATKFVLVINLKTARIGCIGTSDCGNATATIVPGGSSAPAPRPLGGVAAQGRGRVPHRRYRAPTSTVGERQPMKQWPWTPG